MLEASFPRELCIKSLLPVLDNVLVQNVKQTEKVNFSHENERAFETYFYLNGFALWLGFTNGHGNEQLLFELAATGVMFSSGMFTSSLWS